MVDKLATVRTMAVQVWLDHDLGGLGWDRPPPVLASYVKPLNAFGTGFDRLVAPDADGPEDAFARQFFGANIPAQVRRYLSAPGRVEARAGPACGRGRVLVNASSIPQAGWIAGAGKGHGMARCRRACGFALGALAVAGPVFPAAAQSGVPGEAVARNGGLVLSRIVQKDGGPSDVLVTNTADASRCALIQYRHNGLALDSPPTRWLRYQAGTTGRLSRHVVRGGEPRLSRVRIDIEPSMCTPLANAGRVVFQPERRFEDTAYLAARGAVSPDGQDIALIEWQTGQLCRYRMGTRSPAWCTSNFADAGEVRTAGVAFAPAGGPIVTARAITTRTPDPGDAAARKTHTAVLTGYARDGGAPVFRHEIPGIARPQAVTGVAAGPDGKMQGVLALAPPSGSGKPGVLHLLGDDGSHRQITTPDYRPAGVAFIRGGDALAAWGTDRVVIYDPQTLKPRRTHRLPSDGASGPVTATAVAPDGNRLAVARRGPDGDPRLALYDVAQGRKLWSRRLPAPGTAFVDNLAHHPGGGELLVSLSDNSGFVLDAGNGATRFGMTEASPWAYFPDGAQMLLLSVDLVWRPDRPLPGNG